MTKDAFRTHISCANLAWNAASRLLPVALITPLARDSLGSGEMIALTIIYQMTIWKFITCHNSPSGVSGDTAQIPHKWVCSKRLYKCFLFLLNRSYAWLHHTLKLHHQTPFGWNFFKPLAPSCFVHADILFVFATLGFLMIKFTICIFIGPRREASWWN